MDEAAVARLFQQVYAQPADDQVRHVLADALIAAGDPRGELILAQLQPEADHARRAMRLVQAHGISWLGALRGYVVPLAYERGFLASCLVIEEPAGILAADEWATVHSIELPSERIGFALHPVMRSLVRLTGVLPNVMLELANKHAEQMARVTVEAKYSQLFDDLLGRYLPENPAAALVIHGVPFDQADRLRARASRHTQMRLELRVLAPPVAAPPPDVDDDYFDEVEE
ncbi:MAG: hypothetical protein ABI867_43135 [Kofleriaceae bacterium]